MEDPSLGPFDPAQVQIHDFNQADLNEPGLPDYFVDGGLFWTGKMARPDCKLRGNGMAEMSISDHALWDFVDAANAILRPPGFPQDPAVANLDARWQPTGEVRDIAAPRLSGNGSFAGTYWATDAHIDWSAKNLATGYEFSTEGSSSRTVTSQFSARVRNGIFA